MNPTVALPPKARATVYLGFTLLGLVVGAIQVGYLAGQIAQPVWLTIALAVVPFLGAGLGLTAASNTQTGSTSDVTPNELADQPVASRALDADGDGRPDYSG